jgi:8-oxo-dGTP pyrophosphatase MutT (NUDIX family)
MLGMIAEADHKPMLAARQVGALPIQREADGSLLVLLVTSRETGRWIIPKGWPWPGTEDWVAATEEAREEAGILGQVQHEAIGSYSYEKRHANGPTPVRVTVYFLEVTDMLEDWPEKSERQRAWFTLLDAANVVAEPELKAVFYALARCTTAPAPPPNTPP